MTQDEGFLHWKKGSQDAIEAAEILQREGKHVLALFHCHLAAEKALKAQFIREKDSAPPRTHDLLSIALKLSKSWTEDDQRALRDLTAYSVAARYDDLGWEDEETATDNAQWWITTTKRILSSLGHEA